MSFTTQYKCPKCKNNLRMTKLGQRMLCKACYQYYEEDDLLTKDQRRIKKLRNEMFGR